MPLIFRVALVFAVVAALDARGAMPPAPAAPSAPAGGSAGRLATFGSTPAFHYGLQGVPIPAVRPVRATDDLPQDVDDPAIWINHADPASSLIVATMKVDGPDGALAVFGLDGKMRQILNGIDRPNNVDVEYGLNLAAAPTDIAVVTERGRRRLRAYAIARDGSGLRDVSSGGMPILEGASGDQGAPMGIGIYRRPKDGAVFAIVSPKAGPKDDYLWQYRLADDGRGRVKATFVRRFGAFSGRGEIEAIAVDDELGYVYYADEGAGIHKYLADPDMPGAGRELAVFGRSGFQRDREGIGIYSLSGGTGYVVTVDQRPGESVFHVFPREGEPGHPHQHSRELLVFRGGADDTDGLDISASFLGPEFPDGLMVAMNSRSRNFLLFRWRDIAAAAAPALRSSASDTAAAKMKPS
jgi:3-phytase